MVFVVIALRKLAAIDAASLGSRLVLTEFPVGVFGSPALGVLTLVSRLSEVTHCPDLRLGCYLPLIGMNYALLLLYAISLVRLRSARDEIAEERAERCRMFHKHRHLSLWLLVALAVPFAVTGS